MFILCLSRPRLSQEFCESLGMEQNPCAIRSYLWVLLSSLPEQASTREEAARWVEVLKILQTMDEEESKVSW